MTDLIAYYRVSTERQGRSGLGLDAQREAVSRYCDSKGLKTASEFIEIESGRNDMRPELAKALAHCRATGATLIVAKLDRLARSARFLLSVLEGSGEGGVVFCDLPEIPAGPVGKFMVTQLAAVAELEAGMISQRTKSALAAAKARGVKLGNPNLKPGNREQALKAGALNRQQAKARAEAVSPYIRDAIKAGCDTPGKIAGALQARGVKTPRGKSTWSGTQVRRAMRLAKIA